MTEAEWLAAYDPKPMLDLIYEANYKRKEIDPQAIRKMWLFGCACCRQIWDQLPQTGRDAVEFAEDYADGNAKKVRIKKIRAEAENALPDDETDDDFVSTYALLTALIVIEDDWTTTLHQAHANVMQVIKRALQTRIGEKSCHMDDNRLALVERPFRRQLGKAALEVFGVPSREKRSDHSWRNTEVVALAESISMNRAFGKLPMLADALKKAGCDDADLIAHCESPGPHGRGCWAVDAILGRELDFQAIRKQMAKALAKQQAPPPLQPGAVWVTIEEPFGLVFAYDEANRAALKKSALGKMGAELFHDPRQEELRQSGLIQIVDFNPSERNEPFVGQIYVGSPPAKDQVLAKSSVVVGPLRMPGGRLRLEGATSLSIGPEAPDHTGVEVKIPPGMYEVGLYIRKKDKVMLLVLTPRK